MRFGSNEYDDELDELDEAAARSDGESEEGTEADSIDNIDRPTVDAARLDLPLRNMFADAVSATKRKAIDSARLCKCMVGSDVEQ
jgi:hypothetical protein